MIKNRLWELDVLKGIAIIAVVLYHANLFQFGYLGVDLFLVINGYLTPLYNFFIKKYRTGLSDV